MFLAGLIACAITGILILVRIILGKTTFDRILAANSIGTIIVLGISIHGFYMGRPEFIDIVLVFLLLNIVGLIGFLRILTYGKVDVSSEDLMDKSTVND